MEGTTLPILSHLQHDASKRVYIAVPGDGRRGVRVAHPNARVRPANGFPRPSRERAVLKLGHDRD